MKHPLWRLFLACVCGLAAVSAAPAQIQQQVLGPDGKWHPLAPIPDERMHLAGDPTHPSHRPLDSGIGDLAGAEDLLARRLRHTHDMQALQDLVKQGLADPEVVQMLKDKFKDAPPDEAIQKLRETIAKNPGLLDDPKLHDLLKNVEKFKQEGNFDDLPPGAKEDLAKWAKDFIDKDQPPDPTKVGPMTGGPTNPPPADSSAPPPPPPPPPPADKPSSPPDAAKPSWLKHDMIEAMAGLLKDLNRSPEGEALRDAVRREIAQWNSKSSDSSTLTDYLKSILSSDEAAWLARNLKPSSPNLNGAVPSLSGAPSLGDSSDGFLDGLAAVAALALLVVAAWMAVAVARRQAARARGKAWSAGPWPVQPSQVSTRQDLIRVFEHLAFVLLGPTARALNHLDVAARLGDQDRGRARTAERLAHLYEQARYAPPDEPLPADELAAARDDLTALAGAAA